MAREINSLFGWQILAEDSESYMTFPIQVSEAEPITDTQIRNLIVKTLIKENVTVTASEIENLIFIASDGDSMIVEELNPYVFWPVKISTDKNNKNYSKFRAQKEGEK